MVNEITNDSEIKTLIRAIETGEIVDYFEVPEKYRNHSEIIKAERKKMIRVLGYRGYDVIRKSFFVNENVLMKNPFNDDMMPYSITTNLVSFEEYYEFVDGELYDNACYFNYEFTKNLIDKYNVDISRINFLSLVSDTIDDCIPCEFVISEICYEEIERKKRNVKRWITKYNSCKTYEELSRVNENHKKSSDKTDELFYIWNYINSKGEDSFDVIMDFVNEGSYPACEIEPALPFIYDSVRVKKAYKYSSGANSTRYSHKARFKSYVNRIEEDGYYTGTLKYYSSDTHFYCVQTDFYFSGEEKFRPCASLYLYFDDFNSFSGYLNYDLSDCDLTYAKGIDINSDYLTNDNTKLPIDNLDSLKQVVEKRYDRIKDEYYVAVKWNNMFDRIIFEEEKHFTYFFDFLAYLKNDLSHAELLYCDGLVNLVDYRNIDFTDAVLTSKVSDALCVKYDDLNCIATLPVDNEIVLLNEQKTVIALNDAHLEMPVEVVKGDSVFTDNKVYYISDIHLTHKLMRKKAKTKEDIIYVIQRIIDDILKNIDTKWMYNTLLIGGDVSSEFTIFELFVDLLRKTIDEQMYQITVVFVLGNHELWNHEGNMISDIVRQYRDCITSKKMHLLNDEMLYIENENEVSYIDKNELLVSDTECLRARLRKARLILFGGIGFSGCNKEFNANDGIYNGTINREQEISFSSEFCKLYDRVEEVLDDKCVIVFTHMNINDWKPYYVLHDKWIYVSGHNHINYFYDDGSSRLYADNQIGYYNDRVQTKYFLMDNSYDWFNDYEDGIYEITKKDYIEFYRGKNIQMTFNRDVEIIYMLKRKGYYCFIQKNHGGKLTMLNGGTLKKLTHRDIEYYYQNMDAEIECIKTPLLKYQEYQNAISEEIKRLGGNGRIHGAIIDVDGKDIPGDLSSIAFNHVYVNPIDMTITPYYAIDMIDKYVYSSFQALLYDKCPKLYDNYQKLLATGEKELIVVKPIKEDELMVPPEYYPDTDIYKASRELRKMQKLNLNILSTWIDNIPNLIDTPDNLKSITNQKS